MGPACGNGMVAAHENVLDVCLEWETAMIRHLTRQARAPNLESTADQRKIEADEARRDLATIAQTPDLGHYWAEMAVSSGKSKDTSFHTLRLLSQRISSSIITIIMVTTAPKPSK
ncbi:hypothetical protein LTR93_012393, partial [Exophiala xenobiotica]